MLAWRNYRRFNFKKKVCYGNCLAAVAWWHIFPAIPALSALSIPVVSMITVYSWKTKPECGKFPPSSAVLYLHVPTPPCHVQIQTLCCCCRCKIKNTNLLWRLCDLIKRFYFFLLADSRTHHYAQFPCTWGSAGQLTLVDTWKVGLVDLQFCHLSAPGLTASWLHRRPGHNRSGLFKHGNGFSEPGKSEKRV